MLFLFWAGSKGKLVAVMDGRAGSLFWDNAVAPPQQQFENCRCIVGGGEWVGTFMKFKLLHNVFHRQCNRIVTCKLWDLSRFDLVSYCAVAGMAFYSFPRLEGLIYPQLYFWFFNSTTITSIG